MRYLLFFSLIFTSLFSSNISKNNLEIFFDTPDLFLYKNNVTLKYQAKKYLSKKNKVKYNEDIIYISKVKKQYIFKVKHYNKVKFIEEKHPLLTLIKRKDRDIFINLLKKDGIKYPMKLKYILETTKTNISYKTLFKLKNNEENFFSYKFQYPYFINLLYAIFFATIGLIFIFICFKKRIS